MATEQTLGLIVEGVASGSAAERACLKSGDRLLSYDGQPLPSPAALLALEENTFHKESVLLVLVRDGQCTEITVPVGKLDLETRPDLPTSLLGGYEAGQEAFVAEQFSAAAREWEKAAKQAQDSQVAGWFYVKSGEAWEKLSDWEAALASYTAAWERLEESGDSAAQSLVLMGRGRCLYGRSEYALAAGCYEQAWQLESAEGRELGAARSLDELGNVSRKIGELDIAQDYYSRAFEIRECLAPESLEVAHSLISLGYIAFNRSDLETAQDYHTRGLQILQRLAPESLELAKALNGLGNVAFYRGDLEATHDYYIRSLEIWERLVPGSLPLAGIFNNLGALARIRGDLETARNYHMRALEIRERLAPGSLDMAHSLIHLGMASLICGDMEAAQDHHTRALQIQERLAPGSLDVAHSLVSLGYVAMDRGDLETARDYHLRALEIRERLAPGSLDVAHSLNNLGKVALKRGDLEIAQDYHMGTLEIYERLAPGSLDVADVLNGLGNVAFNRGDLETARDYHLRALEIRERLAPGSLDVAHSLNNLGYIAFNRSDLETAQDYHTRGLQIQERLAPGSLEVARSLNDLGRTFLARQHPQAALTYFQQAVEILEQQRTQISAPEARALLLAQHTTEYANLTQCYLTLQQVELAFATLERIRARSFLELLAERRLDFQAQAPADMLAQQQKLDRQRANLYDQLAQLSVTAAEEANIQVLQRDLRDVEHQQQELAAAFRKASPRYASLQYPQPLNCRQAQAALDPGTLQLSYLVGDEQTFLFALSRRGLHAVTLPIGQKVLAERVQSFRETLDLFNLESRSGRAREQGQALYELLLAPVQTDIRKAKRLLLCLDGPLHSLPFAALVTNSDEPAGYLGVQKPLHSTFSMTVYAQIRSRQDTPTAQSPSPSTRPSEREGRQTRQMVTSTLQQVGRLLALGDPLYSLAPALAVSRSGSKKRRRATASAVNAFEVHNPELAALHRRGLSLDPLPHTRAEVEAIGQLFPQNAILHLGAEATKIVVKQKSAQADILHLACHGWLDAKMPFSSGLILSQPEMLGPSAPTDDNGLLQAWEVFGLKLQADLVVLSCCESGLGQAMAGEGLVGLTRAFTYAGARSVLASLWEIHDASTAAFMTYFYTAWKEGASKDVALQQAIVQMRAHPQWKHPFYWAPFLLNGDWS